MTPADAFYEHDGERFIPSELTRGPWDPGSQHAGPPAALIGREIERLGGGLIGGEGGAPAQVGRITFEILRPVPIAPLTVEARVARPGRKVEMIDASLSDEDGEVVRARAWRLRSLAEPLKGVPDPDLPAQAAPPGPDAGEPREFFPTGQSVGYHTAMEYRFISGAYLESGPASVWMRMRARLLAGEQPSPLQRVLTVADSGNGVSAALDWRRFLFINVDLTVSLHRIPAGEWVCLDAVTLPEPNGVGIADSALLDERGSIGRATQTLLVDQRSA